MIKPKNKDLTTEEQILEAAKKVFVEKGFDGARMQQIADEAVMNKALLHYYYRSKDKLFEAVLKQTISGFIPKVGLILISEKSLFEKIEYFVDVYIDMLVKNPHFPLFIIHELSRNPDIIALFIKEQGLHPELLIKQIEKEIKAGKIRRIKPEHLIINMISLCIFPIAAKPIIKMMIFNNNESIFKQFINERKKEITEFIINSIKI